ncbi:hypothetical protein PAPHI01_2833 [Pancytospora philotis]|nr:hypothetical protein PAPHI01_2833 [Pancytospora philotis]
MVKRGYAPEGSKRTWNKSVSYERAKSGPREGYVNLSSDVRRSQLDETKSAIKELATAVGQMNLAKTREEYTFKTQGEVEGVALKIGRLDSLEEQNVAAWCDRVKDVFALCGITSEKQTLYLKMCVAEELWKRLEPSRKDFQGYIDALLALRYSA